MPSVPIVTLATQGDGEEQKEQKGEGKETRTDLEEERLEPLRKIRLAESQMGHN